MSTVFSKDSRQDGCADIGSALILMVSRFVLALQYLLVMWHVRKYQNTKLPFILIAGINFIAACIYLGVTL